MEINENASQEASNANVSDNSTDFTQDDIVSALNESEKSEPDNSDKAAKADDEVQQPSATPPTSQDNIQSKTDKIECPDKFKNEDGTANLDKVLKSYKELEPLLNQKAQWEKERAEFLAYKEQFDKQQQQYEESARQQGFNSIDDMEMNYELANLKANEYAKYLRYTEEPERVRAMLIEYAQHPSEELLSDIEFEFPAEAIKRVTVAEERQIQQYNQAASKRAETQKMANIESVIGYAVEKHDELFDYQPFKQLFVNALQKYGDRFTNEDAEMLMDTMVQMKDLFQKEFEKQSTKETQNKQVTDSLASITGQNNSAPAASQKELDISKMTDKQLAKYLKDFV